MFNMENMLKEITESDEYIKYRQIGNILENDSFVMNLMEEIKELQQEAVILEYNNDPKYLELEEIIKEKADILNNTETYKLYLEQMKEYNKLISSFSGVL